MNVTLTCYGGAGSVTGANFMLKSGNTRFLVDCGLYQGGNMEDNGKDFEYSPASVDALFITHAHIDHIGRVPKLVRDGFEGPIYSTEPTKALARVMLEDALSVMEYKHKGGGPEPLYAKEDIGEALSLWKKVEYNQPFSQQSAQVTFKNAGHILGSAMVEVRFEKSEPILCTGDLGNPDALLLPDTDDPGDAKYVLMESVYGDREHESVEDRKGILAEIINSTVEKDGTILIPAFSLERTQVMLYELNELVEGGVVPEIPVFLDSPLAIEVTQLYSEYSEYFNKEVRTDISGGDDIFSFPRFSMTKSTQESKAINAIGGSKIIIAGAGMSHGGRIIFHEKRYLSDPTTTLLIVGYQVPGSMGRRLLEGTDSVEIEGDTIPVRARIKRLHGYSAHPDRNDLVAFAKRATKAQKFILGMGELKASSFLAQRITDYVGKKAVVPQKGQSFELEV